MPLGHVQDVFYICEQRDGIAYLTLNRAKKFNALSKDMIIALTQKFTEIAADTSIRVVVIAAEGKAFCAGHDLSEMLDEPSYDATHDLFSNCSVMMQKIQAMPQPVIAKVNGIATAAGCQLVATCDLAIASQSSRFAVSGINVGLFCATPMVAISRVMPPKAAFEMLVTGDFIDAQTAQNLCLINRAVPEDQLDEAVETLARKIATKSPQSISRGKSLFYRQLGVDVKVAYEMATGCIVDNAITDETRAGIKAFTTKQPMPIWKDRIA